MDDTIQTLKNEQKKLRSVLFSLYTDGKTLCEISSMLDISYSAVRRFLWGGGFSINHIVKAKNWLKKQQNLTT